MERRTDLPHVTDVIKAAGLIDTEWLTDYARDRGTAVHLATALLHENDLDEESLDPAVALFLPAYKAFLRDVNPENIGCELPLENKELGYCGTADRHWKLHGRYGICDLKTGPESPWHKLQTAGYAGCYKFLAGLGEKLSEDGFVTNETKNAAFSGMLTPAEAKSAWETFKADPLNVKALTDATHPGHALANQKRQVF